ncbi:MAG: zinc ribbon domain-containing protein [Oscillospiraceae bacterium]|nr:zinc ribbon domain-containing protein [Oscillospiraceae bacterium]
MKICQNCSAIYTDDALFCGRCGSKLPEFAHPDSEVHSETGTILAAAVSFLTAAVVICASAVMILRLHKDFRKLALTPPVSTGELESPLTGLPNDTNTDSPVVLDPPSTGEAVLPASYISIDDICGEWEINYEVTDIKPAEVISTVADCLGGLFGGAVKKTDLPERIDGKALLKITNTNNDSTEAVLTIPGTEKEIIVYFKCTYLYDNKSESGMLSLNYDIKKNGIGKSIAETAVFSALSAELMFTRYADDSICCEGNYTAKTVYADFMLGYNGSAVY